jgi:hypothetical protein
MTFFHTGCRFSPVLRLFWGAAFFFGLKEKTRHQLWLTNAAHFISDKSIG